jgi:hypothetical protein
MKGHGSSSNQINTNTDKVEEEGFKMNHAAFYDGMKRTSEIMVRLQKNKGNSAAAKYLKDLKHNCEFGDINPEAEKDKAFFKDFLLTIDYTADEDVLVNSCLNKLINYLDDSIFAKRLTESKTKTSHEDPNILSIDELSKKISNKKKMDKENVGYTILCEMKNLVEQTTTKLATNIEEEDYSSALDKRLINRDLQSLLNSYSNILEVLGQYYVKLEK